MHFLFVFLFKKLAEVNHSTKVAYTGRLCSKFHWNLVKWSWCFCRASYWINPYRIQLNATNILLDKICRETFYEYNKGLLQTSSPRCKGLKSVIWKKKRHLDRENAVLPLKLLLKFIVWIWYSSLTPFVLFVCIKYSVHTRDGKHKGSHLDSPLLQISKQTTNSYN